MQTEGQVASFGWLKKVRVSHAQTVACGAAGAGGRRC